MRSRKPPVSESELKKATVFLWGSIAGWILAVTIMLVFWAADLGPEALFLAAIPVFFGLGSLAMSAGALGFGITFIRVRENGRDFGWLLVIVGGLPVLGFLIWMWAGMFSLR